jgi:hypothetical protein
VADRLTHLPALDSKPPNDSQTSSAAAERFMVIPRKGAKLLDTNGDIMMATSCTTASTKEEGMTGSIDGGLFLWQLLELSTTFFLHEP